VQGRPPGAWPSRACTRGIHVRATLDEQQRRIDTSSEKSCVERCDLEAVPRHVVDVGTTVEQQADAREVTKMGRERECGKAFR
jgi:hypothetical protein